MTKVANYARPDLFFTVPQQERLQYLMDRWRACRGAGESLSSLEQTELAQLIETEVRASAARMAALRPI